MSKRYELLMPASFVASARDSRVSKKSLAATAGSSFSVEGEVERPEPYRRI
jgi:hypothetical protein